MLTGCDLEIHSKQDVDVATACSIMVMVVQCELEDVQDLYVHIHALEYIKMHCTILH